MRYALGILLLCTVNSAMALGEAIEAYRENHPVQTTDSTTTVVNTNPDDSSSTSSNTVIYAPAETTTSGAVVVPRNVDTGNNTVVAPHNTYNGSVNNVNTGNVNTGNVNAGDVNRGNVGSENRFQGRNPGEHGERGNIGGHRGGR